MRTLTFRCFAPKYEYQSHLSHLSSCICVYPLHAQTHAFKILQCSCPFVLISIIILWFPTGKRKKYGGAGWHKSCSSWWVVIHYAPSLSLQSCQKEGEHTLVRRKIRANCTQSGFWNLNHEKKCYFLSTMFF